MKVYVITLRRATERRKYIENHLQSLGLDYELVDAVDYQVLTAEDFARLTDLTAVAANPYLTNGVQACALSHMKVSQLVASRADRLALIIEDDASLPASIKTVLAELERVAGDDEIIALSYYAHFHDGVELSLRHSYHLTSGGTLYHPVNLHDLGSAMAYVLPQKVAARMPGVIMPIRVAADYWGDHYRNGGFSSFRCLHPVLVQAADFRSTLNYSATQRTPFKKIAARLAGLGAALVRKTQFPILFPYLEKRDRSRLDKKYCLHFVDKPAFNEG